MIKSVDQDGNGTLEFEEFVALMIKQTSDAKQFNELEKRKMFRAIDKV
jgi:Ca2+-binding EF-hand superfamily protein